MRRASSCFLILANQKRGIEQVREIETFVAHDGCAMLMTTESTKEGK